MSYIACRLSNRYVTDMPLITYGALAPHILNTFQCAGLLSLVKLNLQAMTGRRAKTGCLFSGRGNFANPCLNLETMISSSDQNTKEEKK